MRLHVRQTDLAIDSRCTARPLGGIMKSLFLSTVVLIGLGSLASAADVPLRRAPAPVYAAVPAFTWSGFYFGAHLGYLWNDAETRLSSVGGPILPIDIEDGTLPRSVRLEHDAVLGGVQAGYNLQFGAFVAGVEADISWADADDETVYSAVDKFLFPGALTHSAFRTELEWFGTVRARVGLPFERALIYATGGLAVGEVKNTFGVSIPGIYNNSWSGRDTEWGWTIGGGVEYALTNSISVKAEYLYYDLGDRNIHATDPISFPGGDFLNYKFKNTGDIVRGGLNFRF